MFFLAYSFLSWPALSPVVTPSVYVLEVPFRSHQNYVAKGVRVAALSPCSLFLSLCWHKDTSNIRNYQIYFTLLSKYFAIILYLSIYQVVIKVKKLRKSWHIYIAITIMYVIIIITFLLLFFILLSFLLCPSSHLFRPCAVMSGIRKGCNT